MLLPLLAALIDTATPGKWAQNPPKKWTLSKKPTVQTLQIVQSEQTVQTVQSYTIVFSFRSVCTVGTLALQL